MSVGSESMCMKIRRVFETLSKELPLTEREFCLRFHGMVDGWDLLKPAVALVKSVQDVLAGECKIGEIEVLEGEMEVVCEDTVYGVYVEMEELQLCNSIAPIIMKLQVKDVKLREKLSGECGYLGLYEEDLFCSPYTEWGL